MIDDATVTKINEVPQFNNEIKFFAFGWNHGERVFYGEYTLKDMVYDEYNDRVDESFVSLAELPFSLESGVAYTGNGIDIREYTVNEDGEYVPTDRIESYTAEVVENFNNAISEALADEPKEKWNELINDAAWKQEVAEGNDDLGMVSNHAPEAYWESETGNHITTNREMATGYGSACDGEIFVLKMDELGERDCCAIAEKIKKEQVFDDNEFDIEQLQLFSAIVASGNAEVLTKYFDIH